MASAIVKRVGLSAGLWAAGDATCQIIVPNVLGVPAAPYDSMQTARQALFGGLFMASAGHGFYGGIEKLLPGNALKKVLARLQPTSSSSHLRCSQACFIPWPSSRGNLTASASTAFHLRSCLRCR